MSRSSLVRKFGWILLPVLALGALGILLRTVPNPGGVRERLERFRAAGLPTTPAELDAWYAASAPADNLALPILEVAAALRGADRMDTNLPWLGRGSAPPAGVPLEAGLRGRLEGFVRANQEPLKAARAAIERPFSRYPVVLSAGIGASLPHLGPVRSVVGALVIEAILTAEQGHSNPAAANLVAGIRVADSLALLPVQISVISSQSLYRIVAQGAERVFGAHLLSEAQLLSLQLAWSNSLAIPAAERALVGTVALYEPIRSMSPREVLKQFDPGTDGSTESLIETVRLVMYAAAGGLRTDYGVLVENWDERRGATQLEYPRRLIEEAKLKAKLEERLRTSYLPVARYFSSIDHEGMARSIALRRAALTACAVERYRVRNFPRLPEQLDQLVPEFLPAVPLDPFDGRPLRYEVSGQRYVIYSVGPDKMDDKGRPNRRYRKQGEPTTWDVAFTVVANLGEKSAEVFP